LSPHSYLLSYWSSFQFFLLVCHITAPKLLEQTTLHHLQITVSYTKQKPTTPHLFFINSMWWVIFKLYRLPVSVASLFHFSLLYSLLYYIVQILRKRKENDDYYIWNFQCCRSPCPWLWIYVCIKTDPCSIGTARQPVRSNGT
jgi:hypothetical protein